MVVDDEVFEGVFVVEEFGVIVVDLNVVAAFDTALLTRKIKIK